MRTYELILVFRADLEEETRNQLIERVMGWMPRGNGEEVPEPTINHWGRRQLAYPIKKLTDGYYVYIEVDMENEGLSEMERNITYVDEILRHLLIRKEN